MFKITKKKLVAAAIGVAVVTSAGVGYAYWTQGGTGTGNATTGTTTAITVNQTSDASGLYPDGSKALAGDFDNLNASSVYVHSVSASVHPFTVAGTGGNPACTAADFEITGGGLAANETAVNAEVPTGTAKGAWSGLSIHMIDNPTGNQDACKSLAATTLKIDYVAHAS
jgi:hypothetical protein